MKVRARVAIPTVIGMIIVFLLILRIISGHAAVEPRRNSAVLVKVEPPLRTTVTYSLQFTGDVVAIQQANIFSKVSGNLENVYVDLGTRVSRNQRLALIDTTVLHQQYQQAEATYENAKVNYQRTKELAEQNLVAKQDADNAETTLKVSRAAFETARTQLGYALITAPFAGYITHRYLDPGALVTLNNSTLFTLMSLDAMKVMINVLEKDIPDITPGKKAVITVDAYPGRTFDGAVTRYAQAVDPSNRTMAVEIDIPNPDHALKPGMFANVTLVVSQHPNAITLPTIAILHDDRGTFVYTVVNDTARRVSVQAGTEQSGRSEVLSGLTGAESVITTGQQFVRENGLVLVQK